MTGTRSDTMRGKDSDNSSGVSANTIFLTEKQLAERWNISVKAIQRWRVVGQGPKWMKFGSAVRYPLAEVEKLEAASLRSSTSQNVED
jgi:predicted DNA-binding transcriptional regulator AlpA